MSTARLHPQDLELLADLVAERLAERLASPVAPAALVNARTLAGVLGVSVDFVRDHAVELGGQKLTAAVKAPWRFDVDVARARLAVRGDQARSVVSVRPAAPMRPRRPRAARDPGEILAIRGNAP